LSPRSPSSPCRISTPSSPSYVLTAAPTSSLPRFSSPPSRQAPGQATASTLRRGWSPLRRLSYVEVATRPRRPMAGQQPHGGPPPQRCYTPTLASQVGSIRPPLPRGSAAETAVRWSASPGVDAANRPCRCLQLIRGPVTQSIGAVAPSWPFFPPPTGHLQAGSVAQVQSVPMQVQRAAPKHMNKKKKTTQPPAAHEAVAHAAGVQDFGQAPSQQHGFSPRVQ
jgi:hypothetical protein